MCAHMRPRTDDEAHGEHAAPWSRDRTTGRVLDLLGELNWNVARVADVGAGRGRFSATLSELFRSRGRNPEEAVYPTDVRPDAFELEGLRCHPIRSDGRLPFPDGFLHATVSLEVIEHVQDPFAFLRELVRVTRPGGRVVVTTPNVLHTSSRLRNLLWGFPTHFDPLPLADSEHRFLSGHIQPISPYFLGYAAAQAGLEEVELVTDRPQGLAVVWTLLLAPLLLAGRLVHQTRIARTQPELFAANRRLLDGQSSWDLLTGRTTILVGRRPAPETARREIVPSPPSRAGTRPGDARSSRARSARGSSGVRSGR